MNLRDRVALITGAARRIGAATAVSLAQRGCHVVVHYHTSQDAAAETADECRTHGVRAETIAADLGEPKERENLVASVKEKFGGIDILINNASQFDKLPLNEFSLEQWQATLDINLTAPMHLTSLFAETLRARNGAIVNLCDTAAARPWPDYLAYMTAKGGLATLTQALARAFAPDVRVFGVAPGMIGEQPHLTSDEQKRWLERVPLARPGTFTEIAETICALLESGDYLTGTVIPIDGGRSAT